MTSERTYHRFKMQKEGDYYVLKCYYFEYYFYALWRTYKDTYQFKYFDSLVCFLRNNKESGNDNIMIYIDMPENYLSFSMKQQLGPSRPYEFVKQE